MKVHGGVILAFGMILGASLMVSIGATGQPVGDGRYGAIAVKGVKGNEDIAVIDTHTGQIWRRFGVSAVDLGTPQQPKHEVMTGMTQD